MGIAMDSTGLVTVRSETGSCRSEAGRKENAMIYKRGKTYWYKFMWQGVLVRESTKQGNDKVARQMESAHRTSFAKGEVGLREPKKIPTLKEFARSASSRGQSQPLRRRRGNRGFGTGPGFALSRTIGP
jgi:hypothetical protein